ncbi:hypothetical protein [Desulfoscipio geothermicus]|uniref:Uncharacterized protein n=1 Tax=Desulfoscipio geothermicus DSM 3669 TaxID=1121426 RepID=A0A1I6D1X8_9FIRM|nr:hypothetical protein [Desulfoscipio geothermicus]SFQ99323.1 hypothetical protein SAMN05660706_10473 [Desulfoscipio geothermicus DSM 3669]
MKKERKKTTRPRVAPGMSDFSEKKATREEIRKGNFTRVTRLSYDETD